MKRLDGLFAAFLLTHVLAGCASRPPAVTPVPPPGGGEATPEGAPVEAAPPAAPAEPKPPVARRVPRVTPIHGVELKDDYFWMRDKDTPEVLDYLRAENAYTDAIMKPTEPLQQRLYDEMLGRIKQTDLSVPYEKRGYWYYSRTEEGKQYSIFCRKKGTLDAAEEIMIDVNELAKKHAYVQAAPLGVSDDGTRLAWMIDTTGFREYTLRVRDLAKGEDLAEAIPKVTGAAWAADGKTLFYTTEDAAKRSHRVWRHTIGQPTDKDTLVYEEKDERFVARVSRTRSDKYLLIDIGSSTTSEVRYLKADKPAEEPRVLLERKQDIEYYVDHQGDLFYLVINDKGRNFRLVSAPVKDPRPAKWKEVIPHRDDVMLDGIDAFEKQLVISEMREGLPRMRVRDLRGKDTEIDFGEPIYAAFEHTNAEYKARTFRYKFQSFVTSESVYEMDFDTGKKTLLKQTEVLGGYDPTAYEQERIFATASDGTRIPISLVRRKGIARDGRAPLYLTGYGAYGFPAYITFDSSRVSLLDRGVIVAVAHIRGGGDMGKRWHDQGRMMQKRNTFTDFIACAEHLIAEKYTSSDRMAILGGSAGGLLIGAVVNMRPELFKAAIARVPFVDVINTMLDPSLPLTVGEFEEWGNPKNKDEYEYMMSYSPYDNVAAKGYPTMLVMSSYNDSQVMYWEPTKWVAKLRALKTDSNPLLLKVHLEPAGHGGKSGRFDRLREQAFVYAFILNQLGL